MGEVSEKDWRDAYEFFKTYAPLRTAAFDGQDSAEEKAGLKQAMIRRYRTFKALVEDNPNLRPLKIREFEVEDRLYGLRKALGEQRQRGGDEAAIKADIRGTVVELVKLRLQERQARIARLEKMIQDEQADLKRDQARQEELADKLYDRVLDARSSGGPGKWAHPEGDRGPRREREKKPDK